MVAKSTNSGSRTAARKVYQKPTLTKATDLSAITAVPTAVSVGKF